MMLEKLLLLYMRSTLENYRHHLEAEALLHVRGQRRADGQFSLFSKRYGKFFGIIFHHI